MLRAPELTAIGNASPSTCVTCTDTTAVGEITYHSTVTQREEPMPVAASIIGAPGKLSIEHQIVRMPGL